MIHVIATIQAAAGERDALAAAFAALAPEVLAEDGCRAYGATVDVPTQIPAQNEPRGDVLTIVEQWESIDHLEAHLIAPHMNDFRTKNKELIAGIELQILEPA